MFWTIVIILAAIWLFGAILATLIMLLVDWLVLGRSSEFDCYSTREYMFGFIASWATVIVVSKSLTDDL